MGSDGGSRVQPGWSSCERALLLGRWSRNPLTGIQFVGTDDFAASEREVRALVSRLSEVSRPDGCHSRAQRAGEPYHGIR